MKLVVVNIEALAFSPLCFILLDSAFSIVYEHIPVRNCVVVIVVF